jgi:hypothetical protein
MPIFNVKRDYDHGLWISNHPHPIVEIDAPDAKTAAEIVCGTELRSKGRAGEYRAQVWPLGGVRNAHQIEHFYLA